MVYHLQDENISFTIVIQLLDLFGTMAFAVSGAFKAVKYKLDIIGVVILSTITGLAGGVLRDLLFGRYPPTAISNPSYIGVTVCTAVAIFFLYPLIKNNWDLFLKFDAVGLGVFTAIGSIFAYQLLGLDFLAMTFSAILSATGGGVLRDLLVKEIPIVLVKELYVSASFIGALTIFILISIGGDITTSAFIGIVMTTVIRIITIKLRWNLPQARNR